MYRKALVLMFAAAPMMAQQTPPAPPATAAAPATAPTPAAKPMYAPDDMDRAAVKAAARADAQGARAYAQEAREYDMAAVRAARAVTLPALGRSYNVDVQATIAAMPAMAPMTVSLGQGFGEGFGKGFEPAYAGNYSPRAPQGWAPQDPADSAWRQAQQAMNRGDYRRAAGLFKDIPVKQPNSVYASDALYWEAFSLYRVGGTTEDRKSVV